MGSAMGAAAAMAPEVLRTEDAQGLDARHRLLRAAERLFAQKGYAATSVHEITDAAETNRALLYYYFKDKHSLYVSVIDEGVAEFLGLVERTLFGPGSYSDRLCAFVRGHLELGWYRGDLARVVHRCLLDGHHDEVGLQQKFRSGLERMEAFFTEAVAAGEFRAIDPRLAARTVSGPTYLLALCSHFDEIPLTLDEMAERVTDQVLRGFQRG